MYKPAIEGKSNTLEGSGHADRCHSGRGGRSDAQFGVFKHKAVARIDTESLSGDKKTVRGGFAACIIFGTDEYLEFFEKTKCRK
jgi:hypothetical protein